MSDAGGRVSSPSLHWSFGAEKSTRSAGALVVSSGHRHDSRVGAFHSSGSGTRSPAACPQAALSRDAAVDPVIVLRGTRDLRDFEAYLLGDRDRPVVALTPSRSGGGPVLVPEDVRKTVGCRCEIYVIRGEDLLRRLGEILGVKLTVRHGQARIWWPALTTRSDPADHPVVQPLEGEDQHETLAELARQFDLSRPHVRAEMRLIEDARAMAEMQLDEAEHRIRDLAAQLRTAQVDRYQAEKLAQEVADGCDGASAMDLGDRDTQDSLPEQ